MTVHNRRKTPTSEAVKPKHKPKAEAALPLPLAEQSAAEIKEMWAELAAAESRIAATGPLRHVSSQHRHDWVEAVEQKYRLYKKQQFQPVTKRVSPIPNYALHGSITDEARYDWDFWRDMTLLRGGEEAYLEQAVHFLEDDPWYHGSGYAKETLISAINRLDVPPRLAERLRAVVLDIVERRNDRHFRAFCRLARKVDAPALREQLTARLTSADAGIRRRARWVLEALAQKDSQENAKEKKIRG